MAAMQKKTEISRRGFLTSAAAGTAALATGSSSLKAAGNPENQPPNVADWSKVLGNGVEEKAYGLPSEFEKVQGGRD